MIRLIKIIGLIFITLFVISLILFLFGQKSYYEFSNYIKSIKKNQINVQITPDEALRRYFSFYENLEKTPIYSGEMVLHTDESTTINFYLKKGGIFNILLVYKIDSNTTNNGSLEISKEGEESFIGLLDNYAYYDKSQLILDRYGNEVVPEQYRVDIALYSVLKDAKRIISKPLTFEFVSGNNKIVLKNLKSDITIKSIYLLKQEELLNYEDYIKNYDNYSTKDLMIEAEDLILKSDFTSSIGNEQTPEITPFEITKKRLNNILEDTFSSSGQKLIWIFNIDEPGLYKIAFRYKQTINKGIPSFRNIKIDGKIPFKEFEFYPFYYTGYKWTTVTLSDGVKPYFVYLDKGLHFLTLEVATGPFEKYIQFLQESVRKLQDIGLDIRKLIGNNFDPNRTWNIEKYMPNVVSDLENLADVLEDKYTSLLEILGEQGRASISDMIVAAELIREIIKEPERIPFYLDVLSEGAASIAQRLSNLSLNLKKQPLGIDKIFIYSNDRFVENSQSKFLINSYAELYKLFLSFTNKNEYYSVYEKSSDDELSVWVNRPVQYVETLQYLIDSDFTRKYGIKVKLSIMQNEQKLILASAAGNTPDVALGISSWIPFDLAIRGALYPLSNFPDFVDTLKDDYNLETLLPYVLENKIYGVTEAQNFYVLFYRKDILEKLDIPIPQTWEDVKKILPEIQRRGMNFFIPMCEQTTKFFNTTAPFIFQAGGRIYTKDGLKAAIGEEKAVKGFELMTELFSIYGLPEQVASFYNSFRYGLIPIGVADFANYILLSNAADEIYGLWDIAPSPGIINEKNENVRYQVASDRADVIFKNSNKKEQAWTFLKWWLSKETQVKYARMLVNRYGPEYMFNTANISAFNELDYFPENHKKVILEQWRWIKEVQRHPGGYMTEREVSNIWNAVVIEGKSLRPTIDRAEILINRELERKLAEFGYIKNGKIIKKFPIYDSIYELLRGGLNEEN
ncbi:bacterial extracellular solute-binding protein [Thermosipho africanus TCF52B]|uniref:Bacterial extracellular solute-binding protein n=1 Tax=Thermosipho africanus (strain TCF52B) TaxID=484019 RepID=B7IEC7_THEAB|nr:extracellular solute-binding protein [Thermosipho africanus]ACJ76354.1 bacterial extracellular solute-binding protein [Thermosipho africanus TCF52B]